MRMLASTLAKTQQEIKLWWRGSFLSSINCDRMEKLILMELIKFEKNISLKTIKYLEKLFKIYFLILHKAKQDK